MVFTERRSTLVGSASGFAGLASTTRPSRLKTLSREWFPLAWFMRKSTVSMP